MISKFYLARRYLFRGRARHVSFIGIISCAGVALGVCALIIAFSIINGVDGGLLQRIMKFKDHVTIENLDDQVLKKVKQELNTWEEVDTAYFWLQTQVFAKFDSVIVPLVVRGIDFSDLMSKNLFYQYVKKDNQEEGFFVGEGLKRRFFITDKIEFYPLEKKLNLKEEKVRGVFKVGLYDIDNYFLVGNLEDVASLSSHYSLMLGVKLKDPYQAQSIKERIEKSFPENIFVDSWIDSNQALFSTLKLEKLAMFIILSLIVIVASFNIFATLTVKVVEKTKDIGILKSLGFRKRSILAIFTFQGLIIGFIGVAAGSFIGLISCIALKKFPLIRVPREIFGTDFLPIEINYADVVLIIIAGMVISFISSLIPAYKASRLSPAKALRYE